MYSFRQKVLISYLIVLGVFFALMFPFVTSSVQKIVFRSMSDRAQSIIQKLQLASSQKELISIVKDEKHLIFYRVGIISNSRKVLYDSHIRGPHSRQTPMAISLHTEVEEAFRSGTGYTEEYSQQLDQQLIYFAKRFDIQDRPYVLRLAFPYQYIQELRENFTFGFLLFGSLVLILFAILTVMILHRLTAPIRKMIKAISTYQEGRLETLPVIELQNHPNDEFSLLAKTITSLSLQIQQEIQTITYERNERETILESIQAGVVVVAADLTIAYLNTKAASLLGLSKDSIGALLPSTLFFDSQTLIKKAQNEMQPVVADLELKNNSQICYISLIVIPKEQNKGSIIVLHDRSQEYRMLEMRKAFIANASHELKTPITIIRGFAETLNEHPKLSKNKIQEITKRITDSCTRMTELIKNLLLLSDIDHLPAYQIVDVDLVQLFQQCIHTIISAWPQAHLHIECELPKLLIQGAPDLLEMAFINILDNGIKYSDKQAECIIRLTDAQDTVSIEIQDQGIGIAQADLPHIFQRFFRGAKAGMKKYSGSGLGLSITETIISKHKGIISVFSTQGQGTSFIIQLPKKLKNLLET